MLKEFREFAMRGNVIDMAIGIIIGAAFGTIVNSLVQDVIMPPIGLLLGNVDFSNIFVVLKEGKVAGAWLDTFWQEPYQGPLCEFPQVLLTPHVGSYTRECRKRMEMEAVDNLLSVLGIDVNE